MKYINFDFRPKKVLFFLSVWTILIGCGGGAFFDGPDGGTNTDSQVEIDTDDIDFELGGMNLDLPEPSVNCMETEVTTGCLSMTGIVEGKPFDVHCIDYDGVSTGTEEERRSISCGGQGEENWLVYLGIRDWGAQVPSTFEYMSIYADVNPDTVSRFRWNDAINDWANYHYKGTRVAGWVVATQNAEDNTAIYEARGTFAVSYAEPVPIDTGCEQIPCVEVRLRGSFRGKWDSEDIF